MNTKFNLLFGTIGLLITMLLLSYAALQEPNRLVESQEVVEARQIELGGELYQSHCASCHGKYGRTESCSSRDDSQVVCAKYRLSSPRLICSRYTASVRMAELGWENGEVEEFLIATIAVGQPDKGMPAWGETYSGFLSRYEIESIAMYMLNWLTEEFVDCRPTPTPIIYPLFVVDLPEGDVEKGMEAYTITYGCAACHGRLEEPDSAAVGSWVGNWTTSYLASQKSGYTAADYLYESILLPSVQIAQKCPSGLCAGPPSAMPANFGQRMSHTDMANVIAYILGDKTFDSTAEIIYPPIN